MDRPTQESPEMKNARFLVGSISQTDGQEASRTISAILNNEDVALDNHIVMTAGIDTDVYMTNPVVPFCHQSNQPTIARMTHIEKRGSLLLGTMEFADAETYPFADTIYRLIRGRFLNAVSISWLPLKFEYAKDRRPDGINFITSRLLETSVVPIPSNPKALITARSAGIDTRPLFDWAEKVLDSGDKIIIPRAELESLRREAKPPTSTKSTITEHEEDMAKKREAEAKPGVIEPAKLILEPIERKIGKRGLYQVAWLASLLSDLGYLSDNVDYEAAIEEDNSTVPAALVDALKSLGQVLIDMTTEEVAEMLADDDDGTDAEARSAAIATIRKLDTVALTILSDTARMHIDGKIVTFTHSMATGPQSLVREGKKLSSQNTDALNSMHKRCADLAGDMRDFIDGNAPDDPEPDGDGEDGERKLKRARVAAAAKARHEFEAKT